MWSMLFTIKLAGAWRICYTDPITKMWKPATMETFDTLPDAFSKMATLRGQVVNGVEMK